MIGLPRSAALCPHHDAVAIATIAQGGVGRAGSVVEIALLTTLTNTSIAQIMISSRQGCVAMLARSKLLSAAWRTAWRCCTPRHDGSVRSGTRQLAARCSGDAPTAQLPYRVTVRSGARTRGARGALHRVGPWFFGGPLLLRSPAAISGDDVISFSMGDPNVRSVCAGLAPMISCWCSPGGNNRGSKSSSRRDRLCGSVMWPE